ncbi:MAG TPA: hypothetical protein VHE61_10500 [Opitutaceae bacterium]|nr:hypothetical protein [Opitutaceae bacterium]
MAQCECLPRCPFFNDQMPDSSGLGAIYKRKYCVEGRADCARHVVFKRLGAAAVPIDLYPNMMEQARRIVASAP